MKCVEDKQSDLSGNDLQLDLITNTCGRNVEINNRQIRTMLSTLASIMLEASQTKHRKQPQVKIAMSESAIPAENKKESPIKVNEKQIDSKIKQLQERIRKLEDKIKQTVNNQKMKEYVANKKVVDQKVQILQNKLSHIIDRIQQLQKINKKEEKMQKPLNKINQQQFIFNNLKPAELQKWSQLQRYKNSLIVHKNTITNGINNNMRACTKLITPNKSVFAIKFNKIVSLIGFGVASGQNDQIAVLYSSGRCYDQGNKPKYLQQFKEGSIVSMAVDWTACTFVFRVDNKQVFSSANIGLKYKDKQFYLFFNFDSKGNSICVFQ